MRQIAVSILAHPDDESLVAGGTLCGLGAIGGASTVLCLTRGGLGSVAGAAAGRDAELGDIREGELRAAGECLGVKGVEVFGYSDGALAWDDRESLIELVIGRLVEIKPGVVITFGPEGLYWHPDHIAVHEIVTAAVERVNGQRWDPGAAAIDLYYATMPEGYVVEMVEAARETGLELQAWGIDPAAFGAPRETITTVVDVRRFLSQKLAALRAHKTQFGPGNVFTNLPDHLAEKYLGYEFFIRATPQGGADPLAAMLERRTTVDGTEIGAQ